MASIRSFLKKNGNKSFIDFPFCEGDLLVIALLSYCNYEQSTITKHKNLNNSITSIRDFRKENTKRKITNNFLKPDEFLSFLDIFNKSSRYDQMQLGFFDENKSNKNEVQFFGLTFFIDDKIFVTFRGTDRSVVGWEEDFDLVLKDVIPSQEKAKNYLFKMVNLLKKPVYVLGHSKGGNLAYFAYYFNDENIKDMVYKVYNLDGPGFKFDTNELYKKNKEKLVKIVPNDDVVGILLNDPSELTICKSSEANVNAHDILTWQLDFFNNYKTLTRSKELTLYSETLRVSINEFIDQIGIEKVKDVKKAIFEIVTINKVKDVIFIYEAAIKNIYKGLTEMKKENPKQIKEMEQLIKQFLKIYGKNLKNIEESRRSSIFKKFLEIKEEL